MLLSLEGEEKVEEEGMGRIKKKKRNRDGRMGELVIAVWRNRAEPRNGFRSTMEQGSLGLVFLPFLVQLGN